MSVKAAIQAIHSSVMSNDLRSVSVTVSRDPSGRGLTTVQFVIGNTQVEGRGNNPTEAMAGLAGKVRETIDTSSAMARALGSPMQAPSLPDQTAFGVAVQSLHDAVMASRLKSVMLTVSKDQVGRSDVKVQATTEVADKDHRTTTSLQLDATGADAADAVKKLLVKTKESAAVAVSMAKSFE